MSRKLAYIRFCYWFGALLDFIDVVLLTALYMVLTGAAPLMKMLPLIVLPVIVGIIFMTGYVLAAKLAREEYSSIPAVKTSNM